MGFAEPVGLKWRSSTSFIIATVAMSLFTDLFLYGLVVPTLPFILEERIHVPSYQIQSYTSGLLAAYAASSVVFSPPAGYLADLVPSRRMPFLLGLTSLMAATALFAIGQSVVVLAIARILQGISAAVVWTIGLALVYDTVGSAHLGKTVGGIFGLISVGELVAPVSGGILYKKAGHKGAFGLGFALIACDFLMRLVLIEKKTAARYKKHEGESHRQQQVGDSTDADSDPTEQDPLISKSKHYDLHRLPTKPSGWLKGFPILYVFKDLRLLVAMFLCLIQSSLLASFDATIPTYAKETFGFDSLNSGLMFIPLILPYLLLSSLFGWACDRYGTKPAATIGYAYIAPALILLRLPHPGGTDQIALFCVILGFCGIGICIIGAPSLVEASSVVEQYHHANPEFFGEQGPYAQLYALNSMVYSLGMTIGPLVSGSLKDSIGYGNTNLVLGSICLFTSLLSYLYIGGTPKILARVSSSEEGVME